MYYKSNSSNKWRGLSLADSKRERRTFLAYQTTVIAFFIANKSQIDINETDQSAINLLSEFTKQFPTRLSQEEELKRLEEEYYNLL